MAQNTTQGGPYFSIDVECIATGKGHHDRAVAQISLVDQYENVLLNLHVKPPGPVASYLTPLTGLNYEVLEQYGMPLQQAITIVKNTLPRNAVLVGQNIGKDVEWLGLKEGTDFAGLLDLAGLYRAWNPQYKSWTVFGQDHVAKVLLNWGSKEDGGGHNAVMDAIKSIRLFNYYNHLKTSSDTTAWDQAQAALLAAPVAPSFARINPTFDGVCMGNRKQCSCGQPFFS